MKNKILFVSVGSIVAPFVAIYLASVVGYGAIVVAYRFVKENLAWRP